MEFSAGDGVLGAVEAKMELVQENYIKTPMFSASHLLNLTEESSDEDWGVLQDKDSDFCASSSPLQCMECEKRFTSSTSLIEHSKFHDGEATCNICQVTFSRAMSLSTHLQNAHHPSLLSCQTCKLTFCNLWQLNKHIGIHRTTKILSITPPEDNLRNGFDGLERTQSTPEQRAQVGALLNTLAKDHTYACLFKSKDNMQDHLYCSLNPSNGNIKPDQPTVNPAPGDEIKQGRRESNAPKWDEEPEWVGIIEQTLGPVESSLSSTDTENTLTQERVQIEDCATMSSTETDSCGDTGSSAASDDLWEEEEEDDKEEESTVQTEGCATTSSTKTESCGDTGSSTASDDLWEEEEEDDKKEQSNSDSEFKPEDISDSDSSSTGSSGGSLLSTGFIQTKKTQAAPDRPSSIDKVRLERCVHCQGGPFMNIDWHLKRCIKNMSFRCSLCIVCFPTRKALLEHSAVTHCKSTPLCEYCGQVLPTNGALQQHCCPLKNVKQTLVPIAPAPAKAPALAPAPAPVPVPAPAPALAPAKVSVTAVNPIQVQSFVNVECPLTSTKCQHCGNGPFFSMKHHMQNCEKRKSLQCPLCKALFFTDTAIVEHFVKAHNGQVVSAGESQQRTVGHSPILLCKKAVTAQNPSAVGQLVPAVTLPRLVPPLSFSPSPSPSSTKPGPVSVMAPVVYSNPGGGQRILGKLVLQGDQGLVEPVITRVATPINLTSTQVIPPTRTTTTSMPVQQTVGNLVQGIIRSPSLVQSNTQPSVTAPASTKPPTPTLLLISDHTAKTWNLPCYSGQATLPTPAKPSTPSPAPLKVMAMFKNESRELAVQRRLKMSWRSKSIHRCRQCGVISRQPSLCIRHRYLHRGPRPHRCHCGRTFHCRLYLLRHFVEHAEASSYICVTCGETFVGARLFARHRAGTLRKARFIGGCRYLRQMKTCQVPFSCHCGKTFKRPSSYLWHQLCNWPMAKLS